MGKDAKLQEAPLATWAAACACAGEALDLDAQGEGWFVVTVDPFEGQQVRAELLEDEEGAGWLVLRAPALPAELLPAREAAELNATQAFATLALAGADYELVYSFPLEALTRGLLVDLLTWMGEEAVALRDDLVGEDDEEDEE